MQQTVDLLLTYKFLKNLVTPFNKWPAYKLGIIDKDGNILKRKRDRLKQEEKSALGYFDIVTLNLKKLLGKLPGGKSAIATYAAAYLLLKEYPKKDSIPEWYEPTENDVKIMLEQAVEEVQEILAEEGVSVPTNSVGGVAGFTKDDLKVSPQSASKYKKSNSQPLRRKDFIQFINPKTGR
jgi:hypothetical protein